MFNKMKELEEFTSVYLKAGLVPCSDVMERGRSLSCLRSRLSSVNVSIAFLFTSSPVEHTLGLSMNEWREGKKKKEVTSFTMWKVTHTSKIQLTVERVVHQWLPLVSTRVGRGKDPVGWRCKSHDQVKCQHVCLWRESAIKSTCAMLTDTIYWSTSLLLGLGTDVLTI